jgi:hypothetical protein
MTALDVSKPLPRLAGATGEHPDIVRFIEEVRARALVRPALTEAHIDYIETALANAFHGAAEGGELLDLWDGVRDVIARRDMPVKWRLEEMGRVAYRWNVKRRGASH